jgi:hypothetical protein
MRRKRIETHDDVVLVANRDQLRQLVEWLSNCEPLFLDNMPAWLDEVIELAEYEVGGVDVFLRIVDVQEDD